MSVTTENLVNLSSSKMQYFSFQKPFINYIFPNSKLILSQKLIKCCKFFKFLHLKTNEARLNNFIITHYSCKIIAGLSKFYLSNKNEKYFYKIESSMKTIKILNLFKYRFFRHSKLIQNYFINNLIPKLDFCQTKQISVYLGDVVFERETLDKIIQPSLKRLEFHCHSFKNVNPGLFVLQKCSNIKRIDISCYGHPKVPILTKNILKEMLKIKRENKIERFRFGYVSEIDLDDLIKLMDNHLASNCFIYFSTNNAEFDAFKQMFTKIQEIRPKKGHGIKLLLVSPSKLYKAIL